ncbi:hypothetical protein Y919_09070 [Caloranaerobacter azorensis H53214]|uniref:DUF4358 domain-containing protein n=1 Tax=Caloranaerobacter azorensis H53214 TaxID=1156417 RepID=A0A096BFI5_9FIRM|nr:hypothetical protein [Caloranaerobacter azorensis]KGG79950.1 hypothetical protein Y919_09070 [Caloranaerobacter azorensis H53214]
MKKIISLIVVILSIILIYKYIYSDMFVFEFNFLRNIEKAGKYIDNNLDYRYSDLDISNYYNSNNIKNAIGKKMNFDNSEVDFIILTFKTVKDAKNTFDNLVNSKSGFFQFERNLEISFINLYYTQFKDDKTYYKIYNKKNIVILFKSKDLNAIERLQKDISQY